MPFEGVEEPLSGSGPGGRWREEVEQGERTTGLPAGSASAPLRSEREIRGPEPPSDDDYDFFYTEPLDPYRN